MGAYFLKGRECKGGCGRREGRTPTGTVTFPEGLCPKCTARVKAEAERKG